MSHSRTGELEQFSWDSGLPLTRPRNNAGPASPPVGRGEPDQTVILPRPTGGAAGANATVVCGVGTG